MNINREALTVYCHNCLKDIKLREGTLNINEEWYCIYCDTLLGFDRDLIGILFNKEE